MDLMIVLAMVLVITVSLAIRFKGKKNNLPPSPVGIPIIGHLHLLASTSRPLHQTLLLLSKRFGSLFYLQLGSRGTLVVSSAKAAQETLKNHDLTFSSRPQVTFASIFVPEDLAFSPYGEKWRELRKLCTLELFTSRRVESFAGMRMEEMTMFLDKLSRNIGSLVNMTEEITDFTFGVMQKLVFGRKSDPQFKHMIRRSNELSGQFHIGDCYSGLRWLDFSIPKMKALAKEMHDYLQTQINERRSNAKTREAECFLNVMLNSFHSNSDTTIRSLMMDIVAAGYETSATAAEWALSEIVRDERVRKKLQQELDNVIPGKTAIIREDLLPNLKYLQAVVKESFRLHPPGPLMLPRESTEECKLQETGYVIPAGTQVLVNVYAIGRDPNSWEDPLKFYPERMLDESRKVEMGQSLDVMPFGYGRRVCPGMNLGLLTVHLILANIFHKFDWSTKNGDPLDMNEGLAVTLPRAYPLELIPQLRR